MVTAAGNPGVHSSKRRRSKRHTPMSEINVTPFVDVMLVLLIIFMVAAPLLLSGIPIDLPKVNGETPNAETDPITFSIDKDGVYYLQNDVILLDEIGPRLSAISEAGYKGAIFIRGDKETSYGFILNAVGRIHSAGFKFNLLGLPEDVVISLNDKLNTASDK
ncbi:MAG: biopolymer transporter ExbD [Hyphomicrobiales bacterium]|nr:biopolymer transporter ExbD [Hyphomicrobiales bacterium]